MVPQSVDSTRTARETDWRQWPVKAVTVLVVGQPLAREVEVRVAPGWLAEPSAAVVAAEKHLEPDPGEWHLEEYADFGLADVVLVVTIEKVPDVAEAC